MGIKENAPEVARDMKEMSARAAKGEALYGETDLSDYLQGVAARNSTWSQLKLHAMPWWVHFLPNSSHIFSLPSSSEYCAGNEVRDGM